MAIVAIPKRKRDWPPVREERRTAEKRSTQLKHKNCFSCNQPGHMARDCPNHGVIMCLYCGLPGHLELSCRVKKRARSMKEGGGNWDKGHKSSEVTALTDKCRSFSNASSLMEALQLATHQETVEGTTDTASEGSTATIKKEIEAPFHYFDTISAVSRDTASADEGGTAELGDQDTDAKTPYVESDGWFSVKLENVAYLLQRFDPTLIKESATTLPGHQCLSEMLR
eukprot:GHVH01001014.1.p1 GENE.GHVH01001014.1~~GHVH01001014.1.p1  ORF type:complete len:241 (-),score=30.85 GHVH01001014.1:584-1261(-)